MRFARYTFAIAGIYGIVALAPMYFLRHASGEDYPPPITHPEYFYGFIGVALAFQIAFLVIASDPPRFRPVMIAAIVEKFSFVLPVAALYLYDRVPTPIVLGALIDLVLGILFIAAFALTP